MIGGGVMGAAALHYLVELGCSRPVLVERETLASGSTGHCAGGVRTLFSDELNVRIGIESIRRLERFEAEVGQQLDLRLWGYLFLLDDAQDVARFESDLVLQNRFGLDARLLTPEEAREGRAAAGDRRSARRRAVRDGGLSHTRPRRAGLRPPRGRAWRTHRAVVRGRSHPRRGRPRRRCRDDAGDDPHRARDPDGRRLVTRARGDNRPRSAGDSRTAVHVLHRGSAVVPARAAADDRLLDGVLLPSRGAVACIRRSRAVAGGARAGRGAALARARGARRPLELVGLLRAQPRSQCARRCSREPGRSAVRHGLLGARLSAGPGDRRAPGGARARPGAERSTSRRSQSSGSPAATSGSS